ncbi:MAG: protein kinase [Acidobacteria bacterium]|nr:protein kinase [Acidobacteriota bacterium]
MAARSLEDRYELRDTLGRGGMGVVYRAFDSLLDREVALKTVLDVDDETSRELFRKECAAQSKVVHPNIVEIFDFGEFTDEEGVLRPFYTMPLLPGKNLRQLLDEKSARLTLDRSIEILRSACRGLQAAHDHGLIHRDLKPANIFVMPDDSVKLIDFGIAHAAESGKQTMLKGTLQYMAPELLDMKQPTAMSDIYSIAVVAYETLGGRLPFPGLTAHELAEAIRERTPPPLAEVNNRIPKGVSQTIHKAMAKQPWHRFSRAQELGDTLVRALAGEAIQLYDPEQVRQRLERAQAAFEEGDADFAAEVVRDLEGEGVQSEQVTLLRKRVDQAMRHGRVRKLLASARRFREAGETPVALKKVSEALDLDPQDADALALRAEIERERRSEKREGWLRVAREHLANGAYERAQEGVGRALELKPDDVEALELRTEIGRVEREAQRARQRKEEIYQTALEAWNRGDVSHALTRMESLMSLQQSRPDADPDRSGTYQKLFQEVRSEHESIEAAHEQARRALSEDRLDDAGEICRKFLGKYPANALFQSLQFDIEERGRLMLSQAIAETDRRVDKEPDLERKIAILTEAIEKHPGESHFERALSLAREKNELVQGIVRKARYLEEQGQAAEALSQWRMLRSIYPPYPALDLEIERLQKRGEQLSAKAERAERIAEIKALLEEDAVDEALQLCQLAWNDSPDDPELEALRATASKRREVLSQVRGLIERAEQAAREGDHERRLDLLREARRLDEDSALSKAALVTALVERARALADSNWNAAAPLVDELTRARPDHPDLPALRQKLEERKRGQFVEQFLARAVELEKQGSKEEAVATLRKALSLYPDDARLTARLNELTQPPPQPAPTLTDPPTVLYRDAEAVLGKPRAKAPAPPQATPEPQPPSPPPAPPPAIDPPKAAEPPKPPAPLKAPEPAVPAPVHAEPAQPVAKAKPAPEPKPQPKPIPPKATDKPGIDPRVALIGGALAVLVVALLAFMFWPSADTKVVESAGKLPVHLAAQPATAEISVDGQVCGTGTCDLELPPGSHRVNARLAGYESGFQTFDVAAPAPDATQPIDPLPISLSLQPWSPTLLVQTNRPSGTVFLDGEKAGEIENGEFELPALLDGEHDIRIRDAATESSLRVRVAPAQAPEVLELKAVNVDLALASVLGDSVRLYTNKDGLAARVDGQEASGPAGPGGLLVQGLSEGFHEASLGPADSATSIGFETGPRPRLAVMVSSDLPTGTLYVSANEDDAVVYLNGEPYARRKVYRGRVRIDPMPGKIKVSVRKPGFLEPAEQEVTVQKGRVSRVEFKLEPEPKRGGVQLVNGPPGAEVEVNGKPSGRLDNEGRLTLSGLEPGRLQVKVQREGFRPKQLAVSVEAGRSVQQDVSLEPAPGQIAVTVAPAGLDVALTLRKRGQPGDRSIRPGPLEVEAGNYTIEGRAEGYQPFVAEVRVEPAKTAQAIIEMKKIAVAAAPDRGPVDYMAAWRDAGGWTPRGERLVRKGGDFVYSPVSPEAGVYRFTALRQGGDPVRWFIRLGENQDYWVFQQGTRALERYRVTPGSESVSEERHDGGVGRNEPFQVEIRVEPDSITTSVLQGGNAVASDKLEKAGAGFDKGRWGFLIGKNDQVALDAFVFDPK